MAHLSRTSSRLLAAGAAAAAAAAITACGSSGGSGGASGGPVIIGQEVCQTGYLATTDAPLVAGAKLAVAQLNAAGGILHRKVQLISKDTQCVAGNEIPLANSFISQSHVTAIIGGYQSAAISGAIPIVQRAKVPFVGAGTLPVNSAWGFTTFPPNTYPGQAFLSYFLKASSIKKLGNISGNTPFGAALQADVKSEATAMGIATQEAQIENTATSTTPVLQKMAGNDAIFTNTSGPINILFAKDAASLGLKVPLIFQDSLTDCVQLAASYQPAYCVVPQSAVYPNVPNPTIKANDGALWSAYQAAGGKLTDFGSVTVGSDQVQLIAKAITAAGTADGAKVNDALSKLEYVGAQSEYHFSPGHPFGMSSNPYVLTAAKPSGLTVIATPEG